MIELICMGCGTAFSRTLKQHNANVKRGRTIVACSNRCVNLARWKDYDSTVTATCLNCKEEFARKKRGTDKFLYCSRSCSVKHNGNGRKPAVKYCQRCNVEEVPGRRKVCDGCKAEGRYSTRLDWTTITLADLKSKYDTLQYHAKLRGMSRSEYKRRGLPMECKIDGYDLHVDICHIRAIKDFPMSATVSEVNDASNLIALCKRCHWEFDNGYLEL